MSKLIIPGSPPVIDPDPTITAAVALAEQEAAQELAALPPEKIPAPFEPKLLQENPELQSTFYDISSIYGTPKTKTDQRHREDREILKRITSQVSARLDARTAEARASDQQVGGDHYKNMAIQPMYYCWANKLGANETVAIRYISRWRDKGGIQDIEKAIHALQLLIEYEKGSTSE